MEPRKKELELLRSELDRLDQNITDECVEIGRRLGETERIPDGLPELGKYLGNIRGLRRTIDSYREDIARIETLARRQEELQKEIGELERRTHRLTEEREARFEEIGAASYQKFRQLPDSIPYRDLFAPLLEKDAEVSRIEEELRQLEASEKEAGFFARLRHKPHKVSLRSSIAKVERAKVKTFFDVGRRVADSTFLEQVREDIRPVIEFVEERRRLVEAARAQVAERTQELNKISRERKDLGVGDNPKERVRELEGKIEEVNRELKVMYCWSGQYFVEHDLRSAFPDDGLTSKYTLIAGLKRTIEEKRRRMDVLRAEMEIDEVLKKEKTLKVRRKQVEEEMRVKERQIAVIDIEINQGMKRIDDLKKVIYEDAPYKEPEPLPPSPDFYKKPEGESPSIPG